MDRNMKKKLNSLKVIFLAFICQFAVSSCQDKSYLDDGGIASPRYNGTVMQFLESRPDLFADLVKVINYAGMKEVFEKDEITFFAPTDWSIQRSMRQLNNYWYNTEGKDSISQITQIKPEVWKELLSLYVVEESYLAKDIPQLDTVAMDAYAGQAYVTLNGRAMNMGIVYHDANGIKYAGYRQLLYSYVNDFGSNDLTNAYVATSDIQPTNGVVHVLRFIDHNFGFNETLFISKAIAAGIEAKRE
jgi:hypothetical protein